MHFIDVSSIISTGKTLSTFPFLTPLLQLPPTTAQTQNTASISLDEKARIVGGEYFSRLFTPIPLTSLSLSLSNRRGRSIYAAERDTRQWTSNVAILKCRYQSHVHLFQPSCEHCFLLFLLVRPAIFTSPWRNMELFSLITIDICLSWVMLFWGHLEFFPRLKRIHCILFNLIYNIKIFFPFRHFLFSSFEKINIIYCWKFLLVYIYTYVYLIGNNFTRCCLRKIERLGQRDNLDYLK